MKPFRQMMLCVLAGSGIAACGASSENSPDTDTAPQGGSGVAASGETASGAPVDAPAEACPLALAGANSAIEDTVDGVVVNFTVPRPGDLPELRRRVERLANAHGSIHAGATPRASGAPEQGPAPDVGAGGAGRGGSVDARASVESGQDRVSLVLRPTDPAQLDSMRDRLRKQADDLVKSACKQAGTKPTH